MTDTTDKKDKSREQSPEKEGGILPLPDISTVEDIDKVHREVDTLAEKYQKKMQEIRNIRKSVEEQYETMSPVAAKDYISFFKRHGDGEPMTKETEYLYGIFEKAIEGADEGGNLKETDIAEINKSMAKVFSYYQELEQRGLTELPVKSWGAEKPESFEEYYLKILEDDIEKGRGQLEKCKEAHEAMLSSGYKEVFDEIFLKRLSDHAKRIGMLEGWLNQLETGKEETKKRLAKEQMSGEDVQEAIDKLNKFSANVKQNLAGLESGIKRLDKDVAVERVLQAKFASRLDELTGRLKERAKSKFFVLEDGKVMVEAMVGRIKEMKRGMLSASEVEKIEKEAEEKIFEPEAKSDAQHEKMSLIFKVMPRITEEKKRLDEMVADFEKIALRRKITPAKTQEMVQKTGERISFAQRRNELLRNALDPKSNAPLEEIKFQLEEYGNEYSEAVKLHKQLSPEIAKSMYADLRPKVMYALLNLNKQFLTPKQLTVIEIWSRVLEQDKQMSLEEVVDFAEQLNEAVEQIDEKRLSALKKTEAELAVEAVQRDWEAKGRAMGKPESAFTPPRPAGPKQRAGTAEEFFGGRVPGLTEEEAPKFGKIEIKKGISEMLLTEGVIDIEPEQILNLFSEKEFNSLFKSIRQDVRTKADNNRTEFTRSLRQALNERLFKSLDKEKRDALSEAVSAQTYSLMRGAVEAEAQKEIARLQSAEASKLAKAGKIGAKLLANVGLAAGIGVGAGLIIGSGGAAAAVAGIAIPLVREINKRIAKSEIFQKAKEKAGSLWGKTVGKLFKKEQPPVDTEQIVEETSAKFVTPEILSAILANQLRENSSQELIARVGAYGEAKKEAMRRASPETADKFEKSLDDVSREFYKNAYNYLAMKHADENLSEEMLSRMAMEMTLTIGMYQRNEVATAGVITGTAERAKTPEEKNWMVDKMEKFMKFRSEGVGAAVFGGALAYAVAETTSAGRVVSGALAGAGLGLMIEKRTRGSEKEKLLKTIDQLISETEKKLSGRDMVISDEELDKVKKDAAFVKAQVDTGVLDESNQFVLRNRAQNFVARVNRMTVERYEAKGFSVDDLLKDIYKQTQSLEKETAKTAKKLFKVFETKNRALVYMGVGAVVGGVAGYFGAQISQYVRASLHAPAAKTIEPTEHDLGVAGHERYVGYTVTPLEHGAPVRVPHRAGEIVMSEEHVIGRPHHPGIGHEAVRGARPRIGHVEETVPAISKTTGGPLEVHEVYTASIKDIHAAQPVYLTRLEQLHINELKSSGKIGDALEYETSRRSHGRIYEDMTTGKQYHADELDLKPTPRPIATAEEIYGKGEAPAKAAGEHRDIYKDWDEITRKGKPAVKREIYEEVYEKETPPVKPEVKPIPGVEEAYPETHGPKLKPINPYEELIDSEAAKNLGRPKGMAMADYESIIKKIPKEGITEKQYGDMVDIYSKSGRDMALKYVDYIEHGRLDRAKAIHDLVETHIAAVSEPGAGAPHEHVVARAEEAEHRADEDEMAEPERKEAEEVVRHARERQAAEEFRPSQEAQKVLDQRSRVIIDDVKGTNAARTKSAFEWLSKHSDNAKVKALKDKLVEDALDGRVKNSILKQVADLEAKIGE